MNLSIYFHLKHPIAGIVARKQTTLANAAQLGAAVRRRIPTLKCGPTEGQVLTLDAVVSKRRHEDVARLILKGLSQCADLSQLPPVVIKVYGLVAVREVKERRQVWHIVVLIDDHEQLCPSRIQEILCHLDVLWVASDRWRNLLDTPAKTAVHVVGS